MTSPPRSSPKADQLRCARMCFCPIQTTAAGSSRYSKPRRLAMRRRSLATLVCALALGMVCSMPVSQALAETLPDPTVNWTDDSQDVIQVEIAGPETAPAPAGEVAPGSSSRGSQSGPSQEGASVPVGSRPAGSQSVVVDFEILGECDVGSRGAADSPCFDVGAEQVQVPEDVDAPDGPAPEEPGTPEAVSGAELATAVREFTSVQIAPAPLVL